jgi:uncharacterized protein YdhG (YjbR/CyaY superfamily)
VKKKVAVQEFIDTLDHPLKSEVQRIRETIKGVNPDITEEIKWNAPSFSYKGNYLVTFNLRATQHVHLVFHNSEIPKVHSELLEGDYADRRMVYFSDMQDVESKKAELEAVLRELIHLQDK